MATAQRFYEPQQVLEQGEIIAQATFFEGGLPRKMPAIPEGRILVGVVHGRLTGNVAGELRDEEAYKSFVDTLPSTFSLGGEYSVCSIPKDMEARRTQTHN